VQVAASVVLLVVSGLLLRALWRVENLDPGFRVEHLLTAQTSLPMPQYEVTTKRLAFYDRVLSAIRAQPGVSNASYISFMPMTVRGGIFPVTLAGHAQDPTTAHVASIRYITPEFFETLGIPIRAGRDVQDADTPLAPWIAVVSESFAAENWPGEAALGRRFDVAFHEREVVGIVGDIAVRGLGRTSEPQVYMPAAQIPDGMLLWFAPKDLVVKAAAPPAALEASIRRIVHDADPDQPVSNIQTLEDLVASDTSARTIQARVLGAFAALACLLAGLGIHGLLTFAVSARKKEIGVRRALGARPINILGLILGRSALLAGVGLVAGAIVAWIAGQSLRALLADVDPADAATFGTAAALALATTIAGSIVAAFRAIRIDPLDAIRRD
jgi:predicted permease